MVDVARLMPPAATYDKGRGPYLHINFSLKKAFAQIKSLLLFMPLPNSNSDPTR